MLFFKKKFIFQLQLTSSVVLPKNAFFIITVKNAL